MRSTERALANVPFLAPLSAPERRRIADHADLATYPAGARIVTRGDPGRTLYVILEGRVRVLASGTAAGAVPLAEFGPGEFFGEMALLEDAPRSADVVAVTPTTCALLTWEVFQRDLLGNPGVATALLTALSRRLRALSALHERPQVETKAPPKERERRILREGEAAMVADIRGALVVKEHNHFTLCDQDGNCPIGNRAGLGLYLGDTRHLSGYELSLGRVQPVVLVSSARLGYAAEQQLTNRDLVARGRTVRKETLLISRERLAHDSGFYEEITVRNFNPFPVTVDLQLRFAADTVTLIYDGLDGRRYQTALTFTPRPTRLGSTTMAHRAQVAAFDECVLRVRVTARVTATGEKEDDDGRIPEETPHAAAQVTRARHSYEEWRAAATRVVTGSELFNTTIDRSLADLRLLVNRLDDQPYFAAGIPWFAALFGRDSLITALQTRAWNPDLTAGTLRLLARYQGTRDDAWRDEEPGKILHELRTGELARTGQVPHTPYYGSIDATPLFLVLATAYHDWTGDDALVRELLPHLDAALDWCRLWGDRDGDGYIEYARRSGLGLANQGWRDSGDGVLFQDGHLPDPPIALVEVQGYLYAAYRGMARLFRAIGEGDDGRVSELDERAANLKERFNRDFWIPERGFFALGLDGRKGQMDAITSNPGQALWTGIVDEARAPAVAARLLSDDLFSGWGVRTLGRGAVYNGRVPRFADLVCYFFEKARAEIAAGRAKRAGLLATNSIRGGVNRRVLDRIKQSGDVFLAWSDEPWVLDGAAVRISIVGFDDGTEVAKVFNDHPVPTINADLTVAVDTTVATRLRENMGLCFYGSQQKGSFDITPEIAAAFLNVPGTFGRNNADVVKRSINAAQLLRRTSETWVIDFGVDMPLHEAMLYETPFEYVKKVVLPERQGRSEARQRDYWWLHARPSPRYRKILTEQERYIASPAVSRHRVFVWLDRSTLVDHALVVFARQDDYFFGVLHSRAHEVWSLRMGTSLEDRPRYTPTTCFETFPLPWSPGREPWRDPRLHAVADAARQLDERRRVWLDPEGADPVELKKRTLTNLYNQRPTWLAHLHEALDRAVWVAYGWDDDPAADSDDAILSRLLALNLERSGTASG